MGRQRARGAPQWAYACVVVVWRRLGGGCADDFGKMWGEKARQRIDDTRTLIIDEVSMISGDFFTQLEARCSEIRRRPGSRSRGGNNGPFGGIQVVATGDFLQVRHACMCAHPTPITHPWAHRRPHRCVSPTMSPLATSPLHGCASLTPRCLLRPRCRHTTQLPPVADKHPAKLQRRKNGQLKEPFLNRGIAFESAGWAACRFTTVLLTQIMRQQV